MSHIIVSGLPRSGTSLMMQMLQAAGIDLISDGERIADDDNPAGYLEFERVKKIKNDTLWLDNSDGQAVKIIVPLIFELPSRYNYKVIVMKRAMPEILASQKKMLARRGQQGSAMPDTMLSKVFTQQLQKLNRWLDAQDNCQFIEVEYSELMTQPQKQVEQLKNFLQLPLDSNVMVNCIDPALYRNRI
ncbi:MAG: sulfotransferase [Colwellia sp.]|nr:sulfotransferase [Colwellia sp.]